MSNETGGADTGELLRDAAERGIRYLAGVNARRITPDARALARLPELGGPLPAGPGDPAATLALLDEIGSPATVATTGGRYFGFVTGGALPAGCPICEDDRQYVNVNGQQWSSLAAMRGKFRNRVDEVEPDLAGLRTEPGFAIAQRACLIRTPAGNLLWDCVSYLDEATVAEVEDVCAATGYSRFPVTGTQGGEGSPPVGYLHIKDVLEPDEERRDRVIEPR